MKKPFTKQEAEVMALLATAHNIFVKLPPSHPDAQREWIDGLHKCQSVLMERVVCRDYPEIFKSSLFKKC